MTPIRLLIADDHSIVRRGLTHLLQEQPGWTVVAEAEDGREAVRKAQDFRPDVVIMDLGMPQLNGFEGCAQITSTVPLAKVLILTMHGSAEVSKRALAAGARGYVLKSDAARDLVSAVQALRDDKTYFTAEVSDLVVKGFLDRAGADQVYLTLRQRQILQLLAAGKDNGEIAVALQLRRETVNAYRAQLRQKLNLQSVSDIVRYAIRNNLLEP